MNGLKYQRNLKMKKLVESLETLAEYCDKRCDNGQFNFLCKHYFNYGTMHGFAESALRVLKKNV